MGVKPFLVITRPVEKDNSGIEGKCFTLINQPLTTITMYPDISEKIASIVSYNPKWIVVTSRIGSSLLLENRLSIDSTYLCIGENTAEPLKKAGFSVIVPEEMNSSGLVSLLREKLSTGDRVALCRSSRHSNVIDSFLLTKGADFRSFDLYTIEDLHNSVIGELITSKDCTGVILTSSMESELFAGIIKKMHLGEIIDSKKVFCIGKPTYDTTVSMGLKPENIGFTSNVDALLRLIEKEYCDSGEWI